MRTYADLIDHIVRIAHGHGVPVSFAQARTAVATAYADLPTLSHWRRYQKQVRLITELSESGTCEVNFGYDPPLATLSSGSWPSWASYCTIHLNGIACRAGKRISSTELELSSPPHVTSDSYSYTIFNDVLELEDDFLTPISAHNLDTTQELRFTDASSVKRTYGILPISGNPECAVIEHDGLTKRIRLTPPPNSSTAIDLIYTRSLPQLVYAGRDWRDTAGTIDVSGSAVTGTDTRFASAMEGCVIRIGNENNVPTGPDGEFPFFEERIIESVKDADELTVTEDFDNDYDGVHYCITDLLDVDEFLYQVLVAQSAKRLEEIIGKDLKVDVTSVLRQAKAADAAQRDVPDTMPIPPMVVGRIITTTS